MNPTWSKSQLPIHKEARLRQLAIENPSELIRLAADQTWSPFQRARVVEKLGELLPRADVENNLERLSDDLSPMIREAVARALDMALPHPRAKAILQVMAMRETNSDVSAVLRDMLVCSQDE